MHRHPMTCVAHLQCGSRLLGTAAAAQLKPRNQDASPGPSSQYEDKWKSGTVRPTPSSSSRSQQPHSVPAAKSWARPQQPPSVPSSSLPPLRRPVPIRSKVSPSQESLNKWTRAAPKTNTIQSNLVHPSPCPSPSPSQESLNKWTRAAPKANPIQSNPTHPSPCPSPSLPPTKQDVTSSSHMNRTTSSPSNSSVSTSSSMSNNARIHGNDVGRQPLPHLQQNHSNNKQRHRSNNEQQSHFNNADTRNIKSPYERRPYNKQPSNFQQLREGEDRNRLRTNQATVKPPSKKILKPRSKQVVSRRKDVYIPNTLTVATLARLLTVKLAYLLKRMRRVGMSAEANYDYILTSDYAILLAEEFGFNPIVDDEAAFDIHPPPPHPDPSSLVSRPPIITIMGHVDHGKTTLLDTLRSASVAKGEAGGITQHIGAFSVPVANENSNAGGPQSITFLDTPGHAAFSAMRARGANVTDVVVLVVAADDGIMPQTKEVINLLKKDDNQVDLVVAINKIDKPGADADSVKKALMAEGIQLEEFGGDIPAVHVSGLTGEGLPELIETLSAVAEVRDLRAGQDGAVYGYVLESNMHKGLGSVATVLIKRGCLKIGSHIISGTTQGKVRRMTDSNGQVIQIALPGMAVTVIGWKMLPKAGDEVLEGTEADIKKALANRIRKAEMEAMQEDAEAINSARQQERDARAEGPAAPTTERLAPVGPKELRLLIKADVSGSCEALEGALHAIGNQIAISKVISTGVGEITESDIMMAKAANATVVAFSVSAPRSIQAIANQNEVPVLTSNIIYRLVDDVRSRIIDMLPKVIETKVTGEATILQLFDINVKGRQTMKVAGCRVVNGLVEKQKSARIVRKGHVVHEGSLDTLRQLKKDITEARKGTECGLSFNEFSDLQEGDLIQMYEKIEKPGVL